MTDPRDVDRTEDAVYVYKDHADEWRWHRVAPNGEIISESSEGYVNHEHAVRMAIELNPDVEDVAEEI